MDVKNEKLVELSAGDPRVRLLLGRQAPPVPGQGIRACRFVYFRYVDGRYLLFHTLTRQAVFLPPREIGCFISGSSLSAAKLKEELPRALYAQYFLVPEDCCEEELYREIKDVLRLKEELPEGIGHYVILPTTACNARCFYCFEQNMARYTMDRETEDAVIRYILAHRPAQGGIRLSWFGGEPLLGAASIDRISRALTAEEICFEADMITNGSLFTQEMAERAVTLWQLKEMQITLDGRQEEYERRKRYGSAVQAPYRQVIENTHRALAAGIRVKLRLNLDKENVGELFCLVDELAGEFSDPEERARLLIYCHSLFGERCAAVQPDLEPYVEQVNDMISRRGFLGGAGMPELARLKNAACMADRSEVAAVIDAEGRLYPCEAMPETLCYGSVKSEQVDEETLRRILGPQPLPEECRACVFLPECTDFLLCPNREGCPRCRQHRERELERALYVLYQEWRHRGEEAGR